MHDILTARCDACGFSMRGLTQAERVPTCAMCGLPLQAQTDLSVPRRLSPGLQTLMGAFAASFDVSPLRHPPPGGVPGFARLHR